MGINGHFAGISEKKKIKKVGAIHSLSDFSKGYIAIDLESFNLFN